ncbi:prolipoprotein diacylglyceryl transferase [Microbacterium sp. LRZ72]|uniref:prolipoprotein diacylglyceryl transferase n=1 Tax=Microbacterium sp. LRZ72 TaxID=2942481 RepID=UPI0029A111AA|nr:prolipoprotein diacylglyceryl transferase [Microbacterium sp. LRZ72]MDX2377715.1 prolipoprotein diacylglyceryl transferase [Microbacterium sp. LRZ72]
MTSAGIPSPTIDAVDLGFVEIRFYALFIIGGTVIAAWMTSRRLQRRGGPSGAVVDIALWTVPFGIVGGRAYHVFTHPGDYFYPGADLWRVLYVWEGGLAIFGAVLVGGAAAILGCRITGVRFLSFADALAPGMLVAQAVGRLGNYFNQELYGLPTTLPWGLQIDPQSPAYPQGLTPGTLFHPLFLYEMLWNLAGAATILLLERRHALRWGKALGAYLLIYGAGRSWFESIRLDPTELELAGIKINVLTALAVAVAGVALIVIQSIHHPEPEPNIYRPGRTPEAFDIGSDRDGRGDPEHDGRHRRSTWDAPEPTSAASRDHRPPS